MSSRSCPDWPSFLEIAPDVHFKHYAVAEVQLPASAVVALGDAPSDAVTLCVDLERNVFNPDHTDPRVTAALTSSHWLELAEWLEKRRR